ncbi:sigma-70 family RNA polymerase sigma factor [Blastopirellula sp. J2-11]|uniref:RNA polymerase sigma factor n=1 Tax=Blastopirellula sp. J2-11 TaxID=2943192 RepID=UPI0021CA0102|nr:sigma-70 family RNA polymerase sigma factor [Blastopirellula sp. J2-11]UUO07237.1 sigma-70 family RNA polymerase sigma factor [Blastopirellula sp. J2-11]
MDEQDVWPAQAWFAALAAGDAAIEEEFWRTYAGPLHRIADRQLSQQLKRRVDPEDVVQSACRTFFRRVRQGEFSIQDRSDLWRLLLTITLNKARLQARFHGRACRGMNREQSLVDEPAAGKGSALEDELAQIDFADFLESILKHLSAEQQEILQRTLDGQTQDEIAEAVGCSQRTVRRMQAKIRESLQAILQTDLSLS